MMTTWPAVMFAKRRMQSANGLVNRPRISTGSIIGYNQMGRPAGITCFRCLTTPYCLIPARWIMTNASPASAAVTPMLLVAVDIPGTRPSMLHVQMKKKLVSRYGRYRSASWPIVFRAISSRTYLMKTSKTLRQPFGTGSLMRRAAPTQSSRSTRHAIHIMTTWRVIERSIPPMWIRGSGIETCVNGISIECPSVM